MLVFGLLMLTWALTRPLGDELVEGDEPPAPASEQSGRGTARDRERPGGGGDARPQ